MENTATSPSSTCCNALDLTVSGRRRFLFSGLMGSALATLPVVSMASGEVDTLLLSCMDYRLMDDVERYMSGRGLRDNYDHVVLAGAALGATTSKFPAWNETFWNHVQVAIDLHKIQRVMLLSHRDCGAYKVILGKDFGKEPELETKTHGDTLAALAAEIVKRYPRLKVERALMSLDGQVQVLGKT
jgi:hypothetical protein